MGMNLLDVADLEIKRRTHFLFEDFDTYVDTHLWTKLAADAGSSVANSDGTNGILTLTTGATDNNECAVATTRKDWKVAANKPIVFEARINYAEAATNAANVAVGLASVIGSANFLVDNGAGPAASFSGFAIYKVDGETVWRCVSSNGTTQTITKSTTTAGGTNDQILTIFVNPVSSTVAEVTFHIWSPSSGISQPLYDSAQTNRNQPIKHQYTYTSMAAMQAGAYVKDGSGTGEVLSVDSIYVAQLR